VGWTVNPTADNIVHAWLCLHRFADSSRVKCLRSNYFQRPKKSISRKQIHEAAEGENTIPCRNCFPKPSEKVNTTKKKKRSLQLI